MHARDIYLFESLKQYHNMKQIITVQKIFITTENIHVVLKKHCILKMCLIVMKIMPQCHKCPKYDFLFFIS